LFCSPLPAHITDGSDRAIARSPKLLVPAWSSTGFHVVPLLVDFQIPPDAVAT
jgi:hypothetical protein